MSCCTPSRGPSSIDDSSDHGLRGVDVGDVVVVPAGVAALGEDGPWSYPGDGEGPVRLVQVDGFAMDVGAVTNDRFAAFVAATGHVTDAERFGWSFVFGGALPADFSPTRGVLAAPWWREVLGAHWRRPEGGTSTVQGRGGHPVVHMSAHDAEAFAAWAGKRLPSGDEWEHAARAGSRSTFPWGEELEQDGRHHANVFQGEFPAGNTGADGWLTTCPVDAYEANAFGLRTMIGNVWEWTADEMSPDMRLLKGGSYLCHESYCRRYRPAARSSSEPSSSTGNIGFRCVSGGTTRGRGER